MYLCLHTFKMCQKCRLQSLSKHYFSHILFYVQTLFKECLAPMRSCISAQLHSTSGYTPLHKMFKSVEGGLSYKYHAGWGLVLKVLAVFFEVLIYAVPLTQNSVYGVKCVLRHVVQFNVALNDRWPYIGDLFFNLLDISFLQKNYINFLIYWLSYIKLV